MGRPVFQYELADPDFSWLISSFQENHPDYSCAEMPTLPVVFIQSAVNGRVIRPSLHGDEEAECACDSANHAEGAGDTDETN